jgi:hypothetical protein
MSKLLTTILPSLLAGGLLFGSTPTVAQPAPPPPRAPASPRAPAPPPSPPSRAQVAPKAQAKAQVKIDLDIDDLVDKQINQALQAIGNDPHIPPHVRQAIKSRLDKVRVKVKSRIAKVDPHDLEALAEQLGELGEEVGEEMEQFGKDMEKWGKHFEKDMEKWGKQFEKQVEKQMKLRGKLQQGFGPQGPVIIQVDPDAIDPDDLGGITFDYHDDLRDAVKDLGSLQLAPDQRARLRRLRAESDQKVERAKATLDRASETLRRQLEHGNASDVEIERAIDNVTKAEAEIRKARILAWVNARRLLDDTQRKRIEAAARGRTR